MKVRIDTLTGESNDGNWKAGTGTDIGEKRVLDVDAPSVNVKTDSSGGTTYIGIAAPGTLTSEAFWQIFKVVASGGNYTLTHADGDSKFDNVWDDRTGLSYS